MNVQPTKISRGENGRLLIEWSDGQRREYGPRELRESCPCATCREQRAEPPKPKSTMTLLPVLTAAEARPLTIEGMRPVGNYAYSIAFSDEHSTGIYTFELLRELGRVVE
jgi:DUF971 family protein